MFDGVQALVVDGRLTRADVALYFVIARMNATSEPVSVKSLAKSAGISSKYARERLLSLERAGVLRRDLDPGKPSRYVLLQVPPQ